ncbi:MAG TPA: hypothetical protein VKV79_00340 [Terriglobia bacterium]|nr:hypothetical protein [Terriglobia bacterium]
MDRIAARENTAPFHLAHVGVECPRCHWKQFVEVHLEKAQMDSPMAREIRAQLEAWIASRCPDHLNVISALSKN